ncbi:hypothetical protein [Trinickia diaoshuihuensis]|uniref:hypothetical protein n=1 Tax=Trinickia diaoshuihuensis TaxID=2292265 RepID=UPI0013C3722D|nr:hypothetical protein [Trinickia diaoshuihuensis]
MAASKNNFFDHVRWLRQAALDAGFELIIAGESMQALLRRGEYFWVLQPQFLASVNGVAQYTSTLIDEVTHFAGWLPDRSKRWPAANDKLIFKQWAHHAGLRVPAYSISTDSDMTDVVVKRAASSFGAQIQGPFRTCAQCLIDSSRRDYYEQFVDGEIFKVWYWNGAPMAAERDTMPRVTGNGRSSFRRLIEDRANLMQKCEPSELSHLLERAAVVLAYFGRSLDDVPEPGERQIVEFRYGSTLMSPRGRLVLDMRTNVNPRWDELREAGRLLYTAIPEDLRPGTLFTADAIYDGQHFWWLEMNSHPAVHPLAYPAIVASLGATAASRASSASAVRRPVPQTQPNFLN